MQKTDSSAKIKISAIAQRVKVTYGEEKLIIPLGNTADPVDRLLLDISQRFSARIAEDVTFVEVRTIDGFLINSKDIISDVIQTNEILEVVDYKVWAKSQEKLLEKTWGSITRPDFAGESYKSLQVGYHKHNKIYATCSQGNQIIHIAVYDIITLRKIQTALKYQFFNFYGIDSKSYLPWNASVDLVVDIKEKKTCFLELQIKSGTDHQPLIKRIELIDDGFKISAGSPQLVQKPFLENKKTYILPPPIIQGSTLDELIAKDKERNAEIKGFEGNKSEGDSLLQIEQIEKVFPNETFSKNNTFYNQLMVNVRVENNSNDQIYITKISSQYSTNEKWIDSDYTLIGSKNGFYSYSFQAAPYNIPIPSKNSKIICLRAEIAISNFPQIDQRRRVHQSLQYPLPLVFTLTDNQNKTTKLTVLCYDNDPIEVMTQQKKETEEKKPFDWWLQCDDTSCLNRKWLGIRIQDEKLYCVTQGTSNNYGDDDFYRSAWSAAANKLNEISLNWPTSKSDKEKGQYISLDLLVDEKVPYALHITFQTFTSHYEEWIPYPPQKILK